MFDKKGAPTDTLSVLKEDGTVSKFCSGCTSMTDSKNLDKKAFVCGQCSDDNKCGKCGRKLD